MTREDYKELKRLREEGYDKIFLDGVTDDKIAIGKGIWEELDEDSFKFLQPEQIIEIAAAIAEYERAQEVNHE